MPDSIRFGAGLLVFSLVAAACAGSTPAVDSTGPVVARTATSTTAGAPPATAQTTITASPATTTSTAPVTTSAAPAATVPLDEVRVDVELVADDFVQPVLVTARPGDSRLYVVDQVGTVTALDPESGNAVVILDIADRVRFSGEQGLLGVAFHRRDPDRLFVHYSSPAGTTTLVEHRLGPDGVAVADGRLVLQVSQPAGNHNGGMVAFGPDGFLYLALGDGGGANDQFGNGQDPSSLLGAILRLDVDGPAPYGIPADNPFADGVSGAPEVWAWGLRNPWRFAFDGTDLWVGDVGQGEWEEVDVFGTDRPGDNAGWSVLEGTHCFASATCDPAPYLAPITEYAHTEVRCSITGGVVYRGDAIPALVGSYLFGDFCSGEVWALRAGADPEIALLTDSEDVFLPPLPGLTSFGVGPDGEVYLMQIGGLVWRLVSA